MSFGDLNLKTFEVKRYMVLLQLIIANASSCLAHACAACADSANKMSR